MDYTAINRHLKELHSRQQYLDEQTALKYVSTLRQALIQSSSVNDVANNLIVLTKSLDYVPKSDKVFALFDEELFRILVKIACDIDVTSESLRGVLRVGLTFLAGVLPITRHVRMFKPLLNVLCQLNSFGIKNGESLFFVLSNKVVDGDVRMNLNIVDFVAKILYRAVEADEEHYVLDVVRSLMVSGFFGALASTKGVREIEGMTGLRGSLKMVDDFLLKKKGENIRLECKEVLKEIGIKDLHEADIMSEMGVISVLKSGKRGLKKTIVECVMGEGGFPIMKFVSKLENRIKGSEGLNAVFGVWNVDVWYALLNVGVRCWMMSGAEESEGDTENVTRMATIVIQWLEEELKNDTAEIADSFEIASEFGYDEVKRMQLEEVRNAKKRLWNQEMKEFDKVIVQQVGGFVKDQRFMELSKGSWVYCTNPLDGVKNYYFVTLSSNSQSLIYKEFSKKHSHPPNIDKDGVKIEFKQISQVISESLVNDNKASGLISLRSERMNVNRIDVITKKGVFAFYVDTKQMLDVWLDGLHMLIDDNNISEDAKWQIEALSKVRMNTQMLELEEKEVTDSSEMELEIESLNLNFYYD